MVKMGNVWDRTVEVLNGRGGMLAGIAALTLFLPAVIDAAHMAYAPAGMAKTIGGAVLTLATTVVALWGQLALIAASTDPATDRAVALRQANGRLAPALVVAFLLALVFALLFLPVFALLAAAGLDFTAIGNGATPNVTAPGAAALAGLYGLVALVVLLFVGVRMLPLYAVVLHERHGAGAITRSWRLTRRHSWRLIGVLLLFLIVLLVATGAAKSVSGLILRLALGAEAQTTVDFLAATVAQAVSAALTLVAVVFSAQLYVALVTRERLLHERAAQAEMSA